MSSIMRARSALTGRGEGCEVIGGSSRAEGCWTFNARDRMPRSSPLTAHPLAAIAKQAPAPTQPSRESGFVLGWKRDVSGSPGMRRRGVGSSHSRPEAALSDTALISLILADLLQSLIDPGIKARLNTGPQPVQETQRSQDAGAHRPRERYPCSVARSSGKVS